VSHLKILGGIDLLNYKTLGSF